MHRRNIIPFWHVAGTVSTLVDGQDVCTMTEILDLLLELLQLQRLGRGYMCVKERESEREEYVLR